MPRLSTLKPRVETLDVRQGTKTDGSMKPLNRNSLYGRDWRKVRAMHLMEHPLCVFCEREGRVTLATVVDHIEPHHGDPNLFWDSDNHQSLCAHCHDSVKKKIENKGLAQ